MRRREHGKIVCTGDVLFATVRPYLRNISAVPNDYDQQIGLYGVLGLEACKGRLSSLLVLQGNLQGFRERAIGDAIRRELPSGQG